MRRRRSRFHRICRKLTRRTPDRRGQWEQIGTLRPHGSTGRPAPARREPAYVPEYRPTPGDFGRVEEIRLFEPEILASEAQPTPAADREESSAGGIAVAALAASLFLLACAYAAFSGYVHSYDDGFAYLGILGAVGSLLAAGIGICLAASGLRRKYSGKFLSLCAISLATLYGVLLFFAMGR